MVSIAADLVCAGLFLFAVIHYAQKGIVASLYHVLKWVLCFLMIRLLFPYAADMLNSMGLGKWISSGLSDSISEMLSDHAGDLTEAIESLGLPSFLTDFLIDSNTAENYLLLGVESLAGYLAAQIAHLVVNLLAILILFVLFLIAFYFCGKVLKLITHLPLIHGVDSFLGGLAGVLIGTFFVWIFGVAVYLISLSSGAEWLAEGAANTYVLKFFNQYNLILQKVARLG